MLPEMRLLLLTSEDDPTEQGLKPISDRGGYPRTLPSEDDPEQGDIVKCCGRDIEERIHLNLPMRPLP